MFSAVRAKYVHVEAFKDNLIATKFYLECSEEINLWMSNFWWPLADCQNEILKSFALKSTLILNTFHPHMQSHPD
jgi:hypothetical protein